MRKFLLAFLLIASSLTAQDVLVTSPFDPTAARLNGSSTVDFAAQISRASLLNNTMVTMTPGDTTPSVASGSVFYCSQSVSTSITDFDNSVEGQVITILFSGNSPGATTTVTRNNAYLIGGANIVVATGELWVSVLVRKGATWFEVSRNQIS